MNEGVGLFVVDKALTHRIEMKRTSQPYGYLAKVYQSR